MFEDVLPEVSDLASLSDAALVEAAGGWARAENAACARKLAVFAEMFARRTGLPAGERELWWVDPQAAVAAEMAAAVNVSQGMALHQTHRGVAVRDRLPQVAALFEQGLVSDLLVRAIVWRTYLIDDEKAMAKVDAALAARITGWGALSVAKTEAAIDALVEEHDPSALRRSRESASGRTVEELARSVCEADPRSIHERRADALKAAVTHTALVCGCGQSDCPGPAHDKPAKNAVVYVIADEKSVDAAQTSSESGADPAPAPPAFVFGAGVLPTALLAGFWSGPASAKCATPAATRHRSRATRRRAKHVSSCAAAT